MSDEELCSVDCCDCGIQFKFSKKIEEMWRKSGKTFHCPNGHNLFWSPPKESPEQTELKKLRAEINELRTKLVSAEKKAEDQQKRADKLADELEIWKPSTTEEKVG